MHPDSCQLALPSFSWFNDFVKCMQVFMLKSGLPLPCNLRSPYFVHILLMEDTCAYLYIHVCYINLISISSYFMLIYFRTKFQAQNFKVILRTYLASDYMLYRAYILQFQSTLFFYIKYDLLIRLISNFGRLVQFVDLFVLSRSL